MNAKRFGLLDLLLALTLACCIVRLWIMPLGSSLWVDEMGTYFVVHHGAHDPSLRVAPQVPASIYYALPEMAEHVAGFSEATYRFFSVLAMAGALFAIGFLARRLFHPHAAWFVVFACMLSRGFNYQADDARPYALGTLVLAAAVLFEVRWLDSGRWRDGFLFAAAAALLWWVHLIFWPFYLMFAGYVCFRVVRKETGVRWPQVMAVFAAIGCALAPAAIRALSLMREASAHVVAPRPGIGELLLILKWKAIVSTAAGAFIFARIFKSNAPRKTWPAAGSEMLILSWWLIDPICLFAFSWITGDSVFVARYLYLALPGVSLTAALLVGFFIPARFWKPLALALGIAVLVTMGQWKQMWPAHHPSDWRSAASALHGWAGGQNVPVICPSPFIEARPPAWRPDYPLNGFLYSNLAVYPMTGHVYPFPFTAPTVATSHEAVEFARSLSGSTLAPAGRFAIYGGDVAVRFWRQWFEGQPELRGWQSKRLGKFGDVEVDVFSRTGA